MKCLKGNHFAKDCTSKVAQLCGEKGCDRPHHKFLHGRLKSFFAEDILMMEEETHGPI